VLESDNNISNNTKVTYQEKLERIKVLKGLIKELSSKVDLDKSYSLEDITSGSIFKCPNQQTLSELFAYQKQLDILMNEVNKNSTKSTNTTK